MLPFDSNGAGRMLSRAVSFFTKTDEDKFTATECALPKWSKTISKGPAQRLQKRPFLSQRPPRAFQGTKSPLNVDLPPSKNLSPPSPSSTTPEVPLLASPPAAIPQQDVSLLPSPKTVPRPPSIDEFLNPKVAPPQCYPNEVPSAQKPPPSQSARNEVPLAENNPSAPLPSPSAQGTFDDKPMHSGQFDEPKVPSALTLAHLAAVRSPEDEELDREVEKTLRRNREALKRLRRTREMCRKKMMNRKKRDAGTMVYPWSLFLLFLLFSFLIPLFLVLFLFLLSLPNR